MEGHVFVARPCERMSAWSMSCWWFPVLTKITVRDQISTVIWKRKSLKGFCLDTVLEGWEDGILKLLVQGILIHSFAIEEHILLSSNKKILYIYTYKSFDAFFFMFVFAVPFQTPGIMCTHRFFQGRTVRSSPRRMKQTLRRPCCDGSEILAKHLLDGHNTSAFFFKGWNKKNLSIDIGFLP